MSIYQNLEKVALESMPRRRMAEAAVPYSTRKAEYKSFIGRRAKAKKPGTYDYVPGTAAVGGVVGGLVGIPAGLGGMAIGGLAGAGIGALVGMGSAASESQAIDNARNIVRSGNYDKALQDEIIQYRRHKEQQARAEREAKHRDVTRRLERIEQNTGKPYNPHYPGLRPLDSSARRNEERRAAELRRARARRNAAMSYSSTSSSSRRREEIRRAELRRAKARRDAALRRY